MEAVANGYTVPTWTTYKQAKAMGRQVRRGEYGTQIVYYGSTAKRAEGGEEDSAEGDREIRFFKTYTVFNVAQIEGLPARFHPESEASSPAPSTAERIEAADRYFEATGACVTHGGNQAFYMIGEDCIQLPPFEAFHDAHGYYATREHETVHWTRHSSRLDRSFGCERWGDEGYAREELVAELGATFLAADLGLALEPRADHAAYLSHWVSVLRNGKRAIVSAASHAGREAAQRAVGLRQPSAQ